MTGNADEIFGIEHAASTSSTVLSVLVWAVDAQSMKEKHKLNVYIKTGLLQTKNNHIVLSVSHKVIYYKFTSIRGTHYSML